MIAEVDDPDIYHQDFTTASSWEEFVDHIEKIIVKWKLNEPRARQPLKKGDLEGEWEKRTEAIYYEGERIFLYWWSLKDDESAHVEDIDLSVSHTPQGLVDMMSIGGDFVTVPSCPKVAQFYGVREFLLLKTDKSSKFSSETKPLSCLTIALNATGCEIPAFVQLLEDWQHFYLGTCIGKEVIADYEMVHLERTPQHCKYLTGLLDTFKSKISRGQQLPSIELAVRLTYSLKMLNSQENLNVLSSKGGMLNLPFGLASDPINKIHLLATWPQLTDQMVVDSQSYSDLEPMQAHLWSLQIELAENLKAPKLSLCLSSLCKMAMEPHNPFTVDFSKKFVQSLDAITESKVPTISKVFDRVLAGNTSSGAPSKKRQGAIPSMRLQEYLYFLFPDADPHSMEPYEIYEAQQDSSRTSESSQFSKSLDGVKSAPPESLVWRLALLLPLIYAKDGVAAAAHMWFEFTEEMRYRWEQAIPIPGVRPGFADHKTCILHQKLQMLNVCIIMKKSRSHPSSHHRAGNSDSEGDGDDEFFDCDTTAAEEQDMVDASDSAQPEGRKSAHPTLKLLKTGESLYIPVTQDLVPKTEDELESEQPLVEPTAAGAQPKVHMYSCSVTSSDMKSFKAANPDGTLEDFVRWYSPGDWIEDPVELDAWGQRRGTLSARMRLPDNMWVDLWSKATAVPASRQAPLFDATGSAEAALAWLEGLSAGALSLALLPAMAHACALRTLTEVRADPLLGRLPGLQPAADLVASHAAVASREPEQSVHTYQRLAAELEDAERRVCTARYLRCKLCPDLVKASEASDEMVTFLTALLELREVAVPGGARGRIGGNIKTMFSEAQRMAQMLSDARQGAPAGDGASEPGKVFAFPAADTKEVVMRVRAPRPSAAARTCPQRMYALHRRDEFRLAGCFTRDSTFF